jgi:hypothetical protein
MDKQGEICPLAYRKLQISLNLPFVNAEKVAASVQHFLHHSLGQPTSPACLNLRSCLSIDGNRQSISTRIAGSDESQQRSRQGISQPFLDEGGCKIDIIF